MMFSDGHRHFVLRATPHGHHSMLRKRRNRSARDAPASRPAQSSAPSSRVVTVRSPGDGGRRQLSRGQPSARSARRRRQDLLEVLAAVHAGLVKDALQMRLDGSRRDAAISGDRLARFAAALVATSISLGVKVRAGRRRENVRGGDREAGPSTSSGPASATYAAAPPLLSVPVLGPQCP